MKTRVGLGRIAIEEPLFLRNSNLDGVDFSDAVFAAPVILDGSSLRHVQFSRARLSSLQIKNCNLEGVSFRGACIGGAYWDGSSGRGVDCRELSMWHSSLRRVSLPGSRWQGAFLRGIAFSGADLRGASFSEARLEGSLLWDGANLAGAIFPRDFDLLGEI